MSLTVVSFHPCSVALLSNRLGVFRIKVLRGLRTDKAPSIEESEEAHEEVENARVGAADLRDVAPPSEQCHLISPPSDGLHWCELKRPFAIGSPFAIAAGGSQNVRAALESKEAAAISPFRLCLSVSTDMDCHSLKSSAVLDETCIATAQVHTPVSATQFSPRIRFEAFQL